MLRLTFAGLLERGLKDLQIFIVLNIFICFSILKASEHDYKLSGYKFVAKLI